MEQVGVVALPCRRGAEGLEALVGVAERIEASAPALVRKRRIRHDVVERLERVAVLVPGVGERVALLHECRRVVVQDHVHPGEDAGGGILLLPVEGDGRAGLVTHLQ